MSQSQAVGPKREREHRKRALLWDEEGEEANDMENSHISYKLSLSDILFPSLLCAFLVYCLE